MLLKGAYHSVGDHLGIIKISVMIIYYKISMIMIRSLKNGTQGFQEYNMIDKQN